VFVFSSSPSPTPDILFPALKSIANRLKRTWEWLSPVTWSGRIVIVSKACKSISLALLHQTRYASISRHITYCSQLWWPYLIKDILSFEGIQQKTSWVICISLRLFESHLNVYIFEIQDVLLAIKSLKSSTRTSTSTDSLPLLRVTPVPLHKANSNRQEEIYVGPFCGSLQLQQSVKSLINGFHM